MLIPNHLKTFLYLSPVDFRKSVNGLSALVVESMDMSLEAGQLFLFRCKRGDKIKALHYAHNCFTLIYCRLEKGKWIFPKGDAGHLVLSQEHLAWLLSSHQYSRVEGLNEAIYNAFV